MLKRKLNHNYKDINLDIFSIKKGQKTVKEETKKTKSTSEKNKIFITDIGKLVNEYLETCLVKFVNIILLLDGS